jgi:hypothetical protein
MTQLPPSLERYEARLEQAVARDLERGAGRRRTGRRRAGPVLLRVAGVGVAAVALVAGLSLAGVFGGSPGVLEQAAAALAPAEDGILHVHILGTQTNADGSVAKWEDESWQSLSPPYPRRQIERLPGGPTGETAMDGLGLSQLYDADTDTVYEVREADLAPADGDGAPKPLPSDATEAGADAGVDGAETADGGVGAQRGSTLEGGAPLSFDELVGQEALGGKLQGATVAALESGEAKVAGHETIAGRDAVRIVVGPSIEYVVDAATYAPLEWRTRGHGGSVVLRFAAYEQMPSGAASKALLDLRTAHPKAAVDTDPTHYQEAQSRLFPNG